MKIKYNNYGTKEEYSSIEQFAEYSLDGDDYGKGSLESAADTATNNSKAIGRLLEVLHSKNIVSDSDICNIIIGYGYEDFKIVEDEL